jgi:hypothetical protein
MAPIIFLDIDGVLCLNDTYCSYHLSRMIGIGEDYPSFYEQLFSRRAVATLNAVLAEFDSRVVISSKWARLFTQSELLDTFEKSGVKNLQLHPRWRISSDWAPDGPLNRRTLIEDWLSNWHANEPFVIIDDQWSGTGLSDSEFQKDGRFVLCEYKVGLGDEHHDAIRRALHDPYKV